MTTLAMLTAISCVLVFINFPYPLMPAFKYELADVPILIATFSFGPAAGIIVTLIASFVQAFILGQDGLMGVDKETFIANYESLVMGIREKSPGTYIVCCSVTSVGANYAGADGLTRDAINWANDYIQEVCIDTGAYFCDVAHDMRDSTSVLDGSYASSNGKTLNTAGLNAFLQYLRTHMVEG